MKFKYIYSTQDKERKLIYVNSLTIGFRMEFYIL